MWRRPAGGRRAHRPGYTAVRLEDGCTGVAYNFRDTAFSGCSVFRGLRPVAGKPAAQLPHLIESQDKMGSSLGLPTANVLANQQRDNGAAGDVLDAIDMLPSNRLAMVGFFGPLGAPFEERVILLQVFEEAPDMAADLLSASEAFSRLPECDLALITSTTIINETVDALLETASRCRVIALLGSPTPRLPEAVHETPVTFLSGISVNDPSGILRVVSEVGGTRFFKLFVTKWNAPMDEKPSKTHVAPCLFDHCSYGGEILVNIRAKPGIEVILVRIHIFRRTYLHEGGTSTLAGVRFHEES